jgi:hypothetical protein
LYSNFGSHPVASQRSVIFVKEGVESNADSSSSSSSSKSSKTASKMTIRTNTDKNGFSRLSSSSKSNSGEDDMADDTGEHGNVAEDNAAKANNDQGESESNGSDAPAHKQSMNGIPEFLAAVWKDSRDMVSLTIFPI